MQILFLLMFALTVPLQPLIVAMESVTLLDVTVMVDVEMYLIGVWYCQKESEDLQEQNNYEIFQNLIWLINFRHKKMFGFKIVLF